MHLDPNSPEFKKLMGNAKVLQPSVQPCPPLVVQQPDGTLFAVPQVAVAIMADPVLAGIAAHVAKTTTDLIFSELEARGIIKASTLDPTQPNEQYGDESKTTAQPENYPGPEVPDVEEPTPPPTNEGDNEN